MPITKNASRQSPLAAMVDFTYADLTNGVALDAIGLPQGAVVTAGRLVIDTAFNSATTDVIDIGDAVSATRYAASVNAKTVGATALTLPAFLTTGLTPNVTLKWTGTGAAPTAGAGRLILEYIVKDRSECTYG